MLSCRRAVFRAATGTGWKDARLARARGSFSSVASSSRTLRHRHQHAPSEAAIVALDLPFFNGHSYSGENSTSARNDGLLAAMALLAAAAAASATSNAQNPSCEAAQEDLTKEVYPILSKAEVAKHTSKEAGGMWVTYAGGVYDITEFIESHPGGAERISMAAGGALEPFWKLYALHKKDEVLEILSTLRIGSLSDEDMAEDKAKALDSDDPYAQEPERHPFFIVNNARPFNAEPPPPLLLDAGFITPNELYYVRNHLPVPTVDPDKYRLHVEVEGTAARCLSYSLKDLKTKFPHGVRTSSTCSVFARCGARLVSLCEEAVTTQPVINTQGVCLLAPEASRPKEMFMVKVVTAIQCAGNRREDMTVVKPVKGLGWSCGAVSNSEWTGVRLRDVLKHAGVNVDEPEKEGIEHIQFEGLDRDLTTCYGSSIPAEAAVDPRGDVILAFEMNGETIPRDHGFPIRAVVPGVVGARNVKWLAKVVASGEESQNHWQQNDYKGFCSCEDWDTADFSKSPAIQQLPVNSAILSPADGTSVSPHDKEITVTGYALSGGGRAVIRVDVSADGGETWKTAELKPTGQPMNRTYAWTLWEASVPIPKGKSEMKMMCKAIDSGYNSQPEQAGPIWNIRGVLSNCWHNVDLKVGDED